MKKDYLYNSKNSKTSIFQPKGAYVSFEQLISMQSLVFTNRIYSYANKNTEGSVITNKLGMGIEYAEVRPYIQGDETRHIDWRVSARKQNVHVKVFHQEKDNIFNIILDQSVSMFFGTKICFKSVFAAHLASAIGFNTLKNRFQVGGIVFNQQVFSFLNNSHSSGNFSKFLHDVVKYNNNLNISQVSPESISNSKARFIELMNTLLQGKKGGHLEIISDFNFWDNDIENMLYSYLRRGKKISLHLICDEIESIIPENMGSLSFYDGQNYLKIDTHTEDSFKAWGSVFEKKYQAISNFSLQNQVKLNKHIISDPFIFG